MAIDTEISTIVNSLIDGLEKLTPGISKNKVEESSFATPEASRLVASNVEIGVSKPVDIVSGTTIDVVQSLLPPSSVVSGENIASNGAQKNLGNQYEDGILTEHARWKETTKYFECDLFLHHVNEYSNWYNNSRQFVRHQSRPHVRPQALTTVTCAFGNLMAPKIVRCLEDLNLCVRQKALLWAVELAATPTGHYQCIKAGLLEALTRRVDEKDMQMKKYVAIVLGHLAGVQDACVEMSRLGFIKWLLKMVTSAEDSLRESSLNALLNASFNETVRIELVQEEATLPFIVKTSKDIGCERCATFGLRILQRCLAGGTDNIAIARLLSADAIPILMVLLKSPSEELQEASMRLLCLLSMHSGAKCQAQNLLGIGALLGFLHKENVQLQTAATAALMSLTVDIKAKQDFIQQNGVPAIIPFIDSDSKILSFNALQLATNIAENPAGRSQLHSQIRKVQTLLDTSHSQIQKRFAKAALQQLRFKHRPFS